jgi:hypothetical protein
MFRFKRFFTITVMLLFSFFIRSTSFAEAITIGIGPPSAPQLSVTTSGITLSLSWSSIENADGYTLIYAPSPYQGPETIGSIDMGTETGGSFTLWEGAAFYLAVQAYNKFGSSGYSNIEHFSVSDIVTGKIPDTGQTVCYDYQSVKPCPQISGDYYGQDACYTINPPSYTKLDSSGNALPDSATSWVMVRDNVTGLIWEVKTDDGSIHGKDNRYTWYDSNPATNGGNVGTPGDGTDTEDFINVLNAENFGGHSDWRLPTIKELVYLVDFGSRLRVIDTDFFPNTLKGSYWSSTPSPYYTSYHTTDRVMSLYFGKGGGGGYGYMTEPSSDLAVRAVRGRKSSNDLVDNGDGTVTDKDTGLMWQQESAPRPDPYYDHSWRMALSYCEKLTLAGYTDWRLPTIKELRSIVVLDTHYPFINHLYFPNTANATYWSSTTSSVSTGSAWAINFYWYGTVTSSKGKSGYDGRVRAVRGGQ